MTSPSEVDLKSARLLACWGGALEMIHKAHKQYQTVSTKKCISRIIVVRKKKMPSHSDVELEIARLLACWGEALKIIHEAHKQYHAVLTKNSHYLTKKP